MLLNNYYRILTYVPMAWGIGYVSIPVMSDCSGITFNKVHGSSGSNILKLYTSPYNKIYSQTGAGVMNNSNIIVGTGNTPVTAEDYCVESEITSGLTFVAVESLYNMDDLTVTYRKTMSNAGASELVIREIGLSWFIPYTSSAVRQVLIYREVLDDPIVVAPGETFTVSITHAFPAPPTN